jgi:hypothetical protein
MTRTWQANLDDNGTHTLLGSCVDHLGSQCRLHDLWQTMYTALGTGLEGSPTDLYTQYPSPELGPSK